MDNKTSLALVDESTNTSDSSVRRLDISSIDDGTTTPCTKVPVACTVAPKISAALPQEPGNSSNTADCSNQSQTQQSDTGRLRAHQLCPHRSPTLTGISQLQGKIYKTSDNVVGLPNSLLGTQE